MLNQSASGSEGKAGSIYHQQYWFPIGYKIDLKDNWVANTIKLTKHAYSGLGRIFGFGSPRLNLKMYTDPM